MARGSDDWLAGWREHAEFIEPYRRAERCSYAFLGIAVGILIFVVVFL